MLRNVPAVSPALQLIVSVMFLLLGGLVACSRCDAQPRQLAWAPSPPDNPLKGLVPYADPPPDRFPHSLEFQYLPLSDLMIGQDQFDWQPLESLLNEIASRGNQAVFRVWMEYPGGTDGIPRFLEADGLKVTEWLCTNTDPFPRQMVRTPDYADPNLRAALRRFILAMGRRYDGDPRVGYITAGLLGTWGEWHTYPRDDLYPTKETQIAVMEAFESAFPTTPVLLRYPAGSDNFHYARNDDRALGYHDDSFAWATLDTGRAEDSWYFVPALRAAGAMNRWQTQPVGGEIRPELWETVFTDQPDTRGQDFDECVRVTHATWLMDTGMFQQPVSQKRRQRAIESVRKMGYDFHVTTAEIRPVASEKSVQVLVSLRNDGVAPFYYDWNVELAALDSQGQVIKTWATDWAIMGLLPGGPDRVWAARITTEEDLIEQATLGLRVVNPLSNGKPLRFANKDQGRDAPGWLTLGRLP